MNDIPPGDMAARARYATLTAALGGEPVSGFHRPVLARPVSWTDADDIDALAYLTRERVDHQTDRYPQPDRRGRPKWAAKLDEVLLRSRSSRSASPWASASMRSDGSERRKPRERHNANAPRRSG